jgi:hypothetical protein
MVALKTSVRPTVSAGARTVVSTLVTVSVSPTVSGAVLDTLAVALAVSVTPTELTVSETFSFWTTVIASVRPTLSAGLLLVVWPVPTRMLLTLRGRWPRLR